MRAWAWANPLQWFNGKAAGRWKGTFAERGCNVDLPFPALSQTFLRSGIHTRRITNYPGLFAHNVCSPQKKYIYWRDSIFDSYGWWNSMKLVKKITLPATLRIYWAAFPSVCLSPLDTKLLLSIPHCTEELNGLSRSGLAFEKLTPISQRCTGRTKSGWAP